MEEPESLWKRILDLPYLYGFQTENIPAMRRELRVLLLKELLGEHTDVLFGPKSVEEQAIDLPPEKWLPTTSKLTHSHHGRPCARRLVKGEPTHRCLTCGLDETCVLCKYCYDPAEHEGHNVFVRISSRDDGGICDCGDSEAWNVKLHCLSDTGDEPTDQLPPQLINSAKNTLNTMLDFCVDVFTGAPLAKPTLPPLDAIVKSADEAALCPELRGVYGVREPPKLWCLLVYDDDRRSLMDLDATIASITGRSTQFARIIGEKLQKDGRATIAIKEDLQSLLNDAGKVQLFPLAVRPLIGVFQDEMADEMVRLLLDLTKCKVSNYDSSSFKNLVGESLLEKWIPGVKPRVHQEQSFIDRGVEMFTDLQGLEVPSNEQMETGDLWFLDAKSQDDEAWSHEHDDEIFGPDNVVQEASQALISALSPSTPYATAPTTPCLVSNSHVKYLMFCDVRLYKYLRKTLVDLYVSALVCNMSLKREFGQVYGELYPRLVCHHAHIDRYPYTSVTTQLSSQLFTTPSIATMLIETGMFEVYMKMLFRLFTRDDKLQPKVFRNRRFGQTYLELLSLMLRNTRKELVGGSSSKLMLTAEFLGLFQGLAPIKREHGEHVLYESERWIFWYSTMPFILQLARSIAVGVQSATDLPYEGVHAIVKAVIEWQKMLNAYFRHESCETSLTYGTGTATTCIKNSRDLYLDPVSLLHPVHAFLGWIVEYVPLNSEHDLLALLGLPQPNSLLLFFAPMCTLAALAQISAGLWVRNGYTIRYQLQCYRDTLLRDIAFSQDIFMVQIAFSTLDPNTVFSNLLHQFEVSELVRTSPMEQQAFYMLDEFLHCLTYIYCYRTKMQGTSSAETRKRVVAIEIVQVLWFNSMSYSELVKQVPECVSTDETFDLTLLECANFQPPNGTHGTGIYSLKQELYKTFDPQYAFFSLSRIEEAERLIESREPQKVHIPPLLPLKPPFRNLTAFSRSYAFALFVHDLITLLLDQESTQAEQSLGRLIYVMLVICTPESASNNTANTAGMFATFPELVKTEHNGASILELLHKVLESEKFISLTPKINKLFDLLHALDPSIAPLKSQVLATDTVTQEEKRRRAKGKEMQRKILADFTNQQKQFMQANAVPDDMDVDDSNSDTENDPLDFVYPNHCVLCCMPEEPDNIFGLLTYTCNLKLVRNLPKKDKYWISEAFKGNPSLDLQQPPQLTTDGTEHIWGPAYPQKHVRSDVFVSGCGHGVHDHCFKEMIETQRLQNLTAIFAGEQPVVGGFLCPLCHGLNNGFIPVTQTKNGLDVSTFLHSNPVNWEKQNIDEAFEAKSADPDLEKHIKAYFATLKPAMNNALMPGAKGSFKARFNTALVSHYMTLDSMAEDKSETSSTFFSSLCNTISQIEISLRGVKHSSVLGGIIVDQLNARTVEFLRVFLSYLKTFTYTVMYSSIGEESINELPAVASMLVFKEPLQWLAERFIVCESISGISHRNALRLAYYADILNTLIAIDNYRIPESIVDEIDNDLDHDLCTEIEKWTTCPPDIAYKVLKHELTIKLRRYALLVFSICGKYDSDDFAAIMHLPEEARLREYLQLPSLKEMLLNLSEGSGADAYAGLRMAKMYTENIRLKKKPLEYPGVYHLISLRHNLESMLNAPEDLLPTNPALCLICGAICSMQETDEEADIKGIGQCNSHLKKCGTTQGIFLIPRRNVILLLLSKGRGAFVRTPYLDVHGETDESMRRGRPHFLLPMRYEAFTREIWLQNGLPSVVARKLDQSQDTGGWETL